jgi:hypothetical protein
MAYVYNKPREYPSICCICQGGYDYSARYKFTTGTRYSFIEGDDDDLTVIARIKERNKTTIFYKTQEQLDREMSQLGESNE